MTFLKPPAHSRPNRLRNGFNCRDTCRAGVASRMVAGPNPNSEVEWPQETQREVIEAEGDDEWNNSVRPSIRPCPFLRLLAFFAANFGIRA
jgi:hypothetical protein